MDAHKQMEHGFRAKVDAALLKMTGQLDNLKAAVKAKEGDARLDSEKKIRALEEERDALKARMDEMKANSDSSFDVAKTRVSAAWQALETGLSNAAKELKSD